MYSSSSREYVSSREMIRVASLEAKKVTRFPFGRRDVLPMPPSLSLSSSSSSISPETCLPETGELTFLISSTMSLTMEWKDSSSSKVRTVPRVSAASSLLPNSGMFRSGNLRGRSFGLSTPLLLLRTLLLSSVGDGVSPPLPLVAVGGDNDDDATWWSFCGIMPLPLPPKRNPCATCVLLVRRSACSDKHANTEGRGIINRRSQILLQNKDLSFFLQNKKPHVN
mmetsp:Transcript_11192/g.31578  ORF Transcript_11192/g.31578 Transcript_11192/m.31578 type:complete len:224 (-) Transcript_11192:379-1050(-)